MKDQNGFGVTSGVHFEFETVHVLRGFYDAEMLCNLLNKHVEQFGMRFSLEKNKTVSLTYNMFFEYWFLPTKSLAIDGGMINQWRKSGQSIYADYPMWDIDIRLHLSDTLAFALSFEKEVLIKQRYSASKKAVEYGIVTSQYVVDKSAGLNFMFVDCDKIDNVIVGFERRRTMLIALMKWYDSRDDHIVETYSPINHERKFIS